MRSILLIICFVLFLVACGDGGTSEPILYPEQPLVKLSSSDTPEYSETQSSSDNVIMSPVLVHLLSIPQARRKAVLQLDCTCLTLK